ncbi:MAG: hypothetical protein ACI9MC_002053 [Kiritimatiellia bacterium]
MAELPALVDLQLRIATLTPDHLAALSQSPSLRVLDVSYSDVGDLGMQALSPLNSLESLDVSSCRVSDVGAAMIASGLSQLAHLDLHRNRLTDVGAASVLTMPRLAYLDLVRNHLRAAEQAFAGGKLRIRDQSDRHPAAMGPQYFHTEVLTAIERAFDGVLVPGPTGRTLYQAEAADGYGSCDQSRDHLGRWQDLPFAHLVDCSSAFAFLHADGVAYYLPALMTADLRDGLEQGGVGRDRPQDIEFYLTPGDTDHLRHHMWTRFSLLTVVQRAAIAAWSVATAGRPDLVDAWRRVAAHDGSGAAGSWFDVFWPRQHRPDPESVHAELLSAFGESQAYDAAIWREQTSGERFLQAFPRRARRLLAERDEDVKKDLLRDLRIDWREPEVYRERFGLLDQAQRRAVFTVVRCFSDLDVVLSAWERAARTEDGWFEAMRPAR